MKALEVKLHIPSPCLGASGKGLLLEFIAYKGKGSQLAVTPNPRKPSKWPNVRGFQVRTRICHIVPVSRAYPPPPYPLRKVDVRVEFLFPAAPTMGRNSLMISRHLDARVSNVSERSGLESLSLFILFFLT